MAVATDFPAATASAAGSCEPTTGMLRGSCRTAAGETGVERHNFLLSVQACGRPCTVYFQDTCFHACVPDSTSQRKRAKKTPTHRDTQPPPIHTPQLRKPTARMLGLAPYLREQILVREHTVAREHIRVREREHILVIEHILVREHMRAREHIRVWEHILMTEHILRTRDAEERTHSNTYE
jgi:hypothetical protein